MAVARRHGWHRGRHDGPLGARGTTRPLRFFETQEVELFRDDVSQARTDFTHFVADDGGSDHIEYGEGPFGFAVIRCRTRTRGHAHPHRPVL